MVFGCISRPGTCVEIRSNEHFDRHGLILARFALEIRFEYEDDEKCSVVLDLAEDSARTRGSTRLSNLGNPPSSLAHSGKRHDTMRYDQSRSNKS